MNKSREDNKYNFSTTINMNTSSTSKTKNNKVTVNNNAANRSQQTKRIDPNKEVNINHNKPSNIRNWDTRFPKNIDWRKYNKNHRYQKSRKYFKQNEYRDYRNKYPKYQKPKPRYFKRKENIYSKDYRKNKIQNITKNNKIAIDWHKQEFATEFNGYKMKRKIIKVEISKDIKSKIEFT